MTNIDVRKEKNIITSSIIFGITLYLSKFLRASFIDNHSASFILGFVPNFGLAFALPFIYVSNRIRRNKPVNHFPIACTITLLLMILNEIRDNYQRGRVFDWYDIYASVAAIFCSLTVFYVLLKRRLQILND